MKFINLSLCLVICLVSLSSESAIEDNEDKLKLLDFLFGNEHGVFKKIDWSVFSEKISKMQPTEAIIVNDEVDKMLEKLNHIIMKLSLDPAILPDVDDDFKWLLIKGKIQLENGWIQGLSSLERVGDVELTSNSTHMLLKMPLTFAYLTFDYQYYVKYGLTRLRGGVDGRIDKSKFTILINVDIQTLFAELEGYKLNAIGKISLKFNGNPLVDWMTNMLTSVILTVLKPVMKIFLSDLVLKGVAVIIEVWNSTIASYLLF